MEYQHNGNPTASQPQGCIGQGYTVLVRRWGRRTGILEAGHIAPCRGVQELIPPVVLIGGLFVPSLPEYPRNVLVVRPGL